MRQGEGTGKMVFIQHFLWRVFGGGEEGRGQVQGEHYGRGGGFVRADVEVDGPTQTVSGGVFFFCVGGLGALEEVESTTMGNLLLY